MTKPNPSLGERKTADLKKIKMAELPKDEPLAQLGLFIYAGIDNDKKRPTK